MSQKTYSTHNNTTDRLLCVALCSIIISTYLVSFVNYDVFADHYEYPPLPSLKEQTTGWYYSLSIICEDGMQVVVRDNDKMACLTDDTVSKNPDWIKKVIPQDNRLNDIKWCHDISSPYVFGGTDDLSEEEMLEYTEEMNIKPGTIAFSNMVFHPHEVFTACVFIPQFNTDPNISDWIERDNSSSTINATTDVWTESHLGGTHMYMLEWGENTGVFTASIPPVCDNAISGGRVGTDCNNVSWIAADIEYDDFESGPIFAWTVPQP